MLKPDGNIIVEAGSEKYKLNYYLIKEQSTPMRNTLHNEPFDHERYERDTDVIMVATGVIIMIAICTVIYIIGVALMG